MKVNAKLYDPRFKDIKLEYEKFEKFKKEKTLDVIDANINEEAYITLERLQEMFGVSRYQIVKTLKDLNQKPLGVRKNIVNGKRLRGVGKIVYDSEVVQKIYDAIPVEKIKEEARRILEE